MGKSNAKPQSQGVLPCNHADRQDWKFFEDFLNRPISPPSDPEEARKLLRSLLEEAFSKEPYRLMRMVAFPRANTASGLAGRLRVLAVRYGAIRGSHTPVAPIPDDRFTAHGWQELMDTVVSRMWALSADADKGETRSEKYRVLGTNTNEPVRSWLPEESGVIPYLRARCVHVIQRLHDELDAQRGHLSLDRCRAGLTPNSPDAMSLNVGQLDVDNEGRLAPIASASNPSRKEFGPVDPETFWDSLRAELPKGVDMQGAEEEMEHNRDAESEKPVIDAEIAGVRGMDDWPLRVFVPDYNTSSKRPVTSIKKSAVTLINRLAHFDKDISCDAEILKEILRDWKGKPGLTLAVPELAEAAWKNRHALRGGPVKAGKRLTKDPKRMAKAAEQAFTQIQFGLDIAPETVPPAKEEQAEFSRRSVSVSRFFGETKADAPLDSPDRSDFAFLCESLGRPAETELSGPKLHALMKEMYVEFVARSPEEAKIQLKGKPWDPATDHLSDLLMSALQVKEPTPMYPPDKAAKKKSNELEFNF